jgi:hypothetical protein
MRQAIHTSRDIGKSQNKTSIKALNGLCATDQCTSLAATRVYYACRGAPPLRICIRKLGGPPLFADVLKAVESLIGVRCRRADFSRH